MLNRLLAVAGLFLVLNGCAVNKDPQRNYILALQKGKIKEDTSYVYALPYKQGTRHLMIQGYYSSFSHKNRMAVDFKMRKGTGILAARDGVVVRLEEQHNKGGLKKGYRQYGNYLVIEHNDKSRAGYWHLQQNGVLVNIGDTVKQGQLIALSGNTGYSSMPHLHFVVWTNKDGRWQTIPTRFKTKKGAKYLRPFRSYKNK